MAYLNLVFKGAHSNTLYSAYYDGTAWHGNTKIQDQPGQLTPESTLNPGSCLYNNRLYLVYKGADSPHLYMAYYDGVKWYGDHKISSLPGGISPQSDSSPSLVVFRNLLYAVYKGNDTSDLYIAWFDGTRWYGDVRIAEQPGELSPQTDHGIDLVSFNNLLYLVYKGAHSNELYTAWFDGQTWSGNTRIRDQAGQLTPESNYNPGTAVFNGNLYLVYKGAHANELYTSWFDGHTWYGNTKVRDQAGTLAPESNYNPGVVVFNNRLYLIYKDAHSNTLYSAHFDGTAWSGNTAISQQPGGIAPACHYNPDLDFLPTAPGAMARWLREVPDATPIGDINVPGTHDSAAINTTFKTPYACHNTSLGQQLDSGVRLLDLRLKVKEADASYGFVTCHGNIGAHEYQSFDSALQECQKFLTSNPTEFVAMSLKVDDWNGATNKPAAYAALAALLQRYPVFSSRTMPSLRQVRGRIYLLNRMTEDLALGVPVGWSDNTTGSWASASPAREFRLYVQDQYEGLPVLDSEAAKLAVFTAAFDKTGPGEMLLNVASATYAGIFGVYMTAHVLGYLGARPAAKRPARLGWALFDYETTTSQTNLHGFLSVVQLIIASNFHYRGYEAAFRVIGDGKDEL